MSLCLGLDLGTTKIAAALVDVSTRNMLAATSCLSMANLNLGNGRSEQDVEKILNWVDKCVVEIPANLRKEVSAIGITGQMHGVLLWNPGDMKPSSLITWQDQRCNSNGFIDELQEATGDCTIKSGYACASLAWLAKNNPMFLESYSYCSTIQDYLLSLICELHFSVTDFSDAASWGFFDIKDFKWQEDKINHAGIPASMLPRILKIGDVAGNLCSNYAQRWGLREGTPVIVPVGDNQASLYATLEHPSKQIALTLGTGGRLSVISPVLDANLLCDTFEYRPYVDGTYAAVAASLSGGSASAWLVNTAAGWMEALGITPPSRDALYSRLTSLGLKSFDTDLEIKPHFLGERHDPSLKASISGIDFDNFTPGKVAAALAQGVVRNLKSMLPDQLLDGKEEIVGSGNAIRRSQLMQKTIEDNFNLPLRISEGQEEAACGAALLAGRAMRL